MSGGERAITSRELRLTAALYALKNGVLDHARETGRLPERIPTGGSDIAMRWLIETRGTDIELTHDEQLVLEAIVREGRLPGGSVVLLDEEGADGR